MNIFAAVPSKKNDTVTQRKADIANTIQQIILNN